ncbi:hypothetical protein WOLCODRAFT_159761 [Wolfiporia cocos MD-104 SS10]|uniref:Uncharacterized protein n=1 Tax=Wolfiporia cocos (strain MD-104) TaxID=742152 RepID=A0A2H3IU92_WOLCO|nr:hypothetical protein WOLCODRAFT_159761 [Wolfiporia cocos MD-104 SS10]
MTSCATAYEDSDASPPNATDGAAAIGWSLSVSQDGARWDASAPFDASRGRRMNTTQSLVERGRQVGHLPEDLVLFAPRRMVICRVAIIIEGRFSRHRALTGSGNASAPTRSARCPGEEICLPDAPAKPPRCASRKADSLWTFLGLRALPDDATKYDGPARPVPHMTALRARTHNAQTLWRMCAPAPSRSALAVRRTIAVLSPAADPAQGRSSISMQRRACAQCRMWRPGSRLSPTAEHAAHRRPGSGTHSGMRPSPAPQGARGFSASPVLLLDCLRIASLNAAVCAHVCFSGTFHAAPSSPRTTCDFDVEIGMRSGISPFVLSSPLARVTSFNPSPIWSSGLGFLRLQVPAAFPSTWASTLA